jgi:hypothetical protein
MNLTPDSESIVYDAIKATLAAHPGAELVGMSCLARGADSIFAQAVLDSGGALEVVLPSRNYRQAKVKPDDAPRFDALIGRATVVHTLPNAEANREAYEAANEVMLSSSDVLLAVWDGQAGVDRGSTAAVVHEAHRRELPVIVVWPDGATRA